MAPLKELESLATGGFVHSEQEASNVKRKMEASQGAYDENCFPDSACLSGKSNKETCEHDPVKNYTMNLPTSRNCLEDMELETRALTEPLPTNQQACP